ncbi:MAG: hypothetical protein HY904_18225 [Deltaproteobacteria bacterium]|nr:hypothetical protein [Deltaproteobacteria bacterium]
MAAAKKPDPRRFVFEDEGEIRLKGKKPPVPFSVRTLPVPWRVPDGLHVFDQFGGGEPWEIPLPADLVDMPPLRLMEAGPETIFLAQRFRQGAIERFEEVTVVDVDRASVCVTPRKIVEGISGEGLFEADDRLVASDAPWMQFTLDSIPALAIKVSLGDGAYPLWNALDGTGRVVGWVLDMGQAHLPPERLPPVKVPDVLQPIAIKQDKLLLVCRKVPTASMVDLVKSLKAPRSLDAVPRGDGAIIGQLELKTIDPPDYHWYATEIAGSSIATPARVYRMLFRNSQVQTNPAEWNTMLVLLHALGADGDAVLCRADGDRVVTANLGSP